MSDNNEIVLRNGRFYRRSVTEYDLGAQEAALAKCISQQSIFLKNVAKGPNGQPVSYVVGKTLAAIVELKELPFSTYFEICDEDHGILVPVFHPHRGTIKLSDPWPCALSGGRVFFVLLFASTAENSWAPSTCYLFLHHKGELKTFGYPNIFGDGRICMGHSWDAKRSAGPGASVLDELEYSWTVFMETQMNDHLTSEQTQAMFTKDLEGKWIMPEASRGYAVCGVSFMGGFAP